MMRYLEKDRHAFMFPLSLSNFSESEKRVRQRKGRALRFAPFCTASHSTRPKSGLFSPFGLLPLTQRAYRPVEGATKSHRCTTWLSRVFPFAFSRSLCVIGADNLWYGKSGLRPTACFCHTTEHLLIPFTRPQRKQKKTPVMHSTPVQGKVMAAVAQLERGERPTRDRPNKSNSEEQGRATLTGRTFMGWFVFNGCLKGCNCAMINGNNIVLFQHSSAELNGEEEKTMTLEHALCIDLKHRNIRVYIPRALLPARCDEVVQTLCSAPLTCSDDMYRLLTALKQLPDHEALPPRAVALGLAIVLSNFDFLLDDKRRSELSTFFKNSGYTLIYDRTNGLWTPPELLTYPPVLRTQHDVSMTLH